MMESLKAKLPAHEDDPDEYHRLIARIQALHASYEQLTAPADANGAGGADAARAALQGDLDKHTAELGTIREREAEERAQLDALREQLDASQPHVERLRKERETCLDVVSRLRDQMSAINEQWQAKFDEFKASMDAWAQERRDVLKERCAPPLPLSAFSPIRDWHPKRALCAVVCPLRRLPVKCGL